MGALAALGVKVVPVSAKRWKPVFGLSGPGVTKAHSRYMASALFPHLEKELSRQKDHGRAEALLIAVYGHIRERQSSGEKPSSELVTRLDDALV